MAVAYRKLRQYLGLKSDDIKIFELTQQIAVVDEDVLKRFGADVIGIRPGVPKKWKKDFLSDGSEAYFPEDYNPEIQENGSKILRDLIGYFGYNYNLHPTLIMPKDSFYYDFAYHPLADARNKRDIDNFKWFWEIPDSDLERIKQEVNYFLKETDYGVLVNTLWGGWGQHIEVLQNLRGWDQFMVDLCIDKTLARYMMEIRLENVLRRWEKMLRVIGDDIQLVTMGDDLGLQDGTAMSPDLYREMVKPIHKEFISFIKKRTRAKIWMHNCGSIYDLIPDFIELGIDVINPVQVSARNMDTKKLKKEFGKDIVFWGAGCDSQNVLPWGKPEDIREEVKRRIEDLAPGGGFVFAPIMNIQLDVPVENIIAMFETALEYGKY
jgi:uroporphyrinogen decarboxylase